MSGPYWLRSTPQDPGQAPSADLSSEQEFPPLSTTPISSSQLLMASPSSTRDVTIMESITTTLAEITASIKEIREQQALTNAEVGRFQHELATIRSSGGETSGRDPERASVMRTPQVERAPVRRTLLQPW